MSGYTVRGERLGGDSSSGGRHEQFRPYKWNGSPLMAVDAPNSDAQRDARQREKLKATLARKAAEQQPAMSVVGNKVRCV